MSYLTFMLTGIFVIHNHLMEIGFMMSDTFKNILLNGTLLRKCSFLCKITKIII